MINKTPAVGRIVIRHSDLPGHFVNREWIGKITAINGKRITFNRRTDDGVEERFMLDKTVLCVVDTEAEVERVLDVADELESSYKSRVMNNLDAWKSFMGESQ